MPVIPSGVEESLDNSELARDVSTSLDMTRRLFAALDVYRDHIAHSAAMNMAIDEALLEHLTIPAVRFYRWQSSALSFGYFGRFADVAMYQGKRDLVRRWTGGGIVFHGEDLTYSILIPANDAAFSKSSILIYEQIHRALVDALGYDGELAELLAVAAVCDRRKSRKGDLQVAPAVTDRRYSDCFANPVRADVMINGRKVAGAAQRRTRRGLLQQGSIQGIDLENDLAQRFARELSVDHSVRKLDGEILNRARELAEQKYGTDAWLRKR
jgi:lipoate-protein ligase A